MMLGFYEEMAEFAAMSEDEGFLGQCATELGEGTCVHEGSVNLKRETNAAPDNPRQLQLLIIEAGSRVI